MARAPRERPASAKAARPRPRPPRDDGPDVIVEFLFEKGLLHLAVRNVGPKPAQQVSVRFNRKFRGAGGRVVVPVLAMFDNIESLGPGREVRTFVDSAPSYFSRREPRRITAWATFSDGRGGWYRRRTDHDLGIYEDILYVPAPSDADSGPGGART